MPIQGEVDFLRKLRDELALHYNLDVQTEPSDAGVDLLVHDQVSGKTVAIEIKDAGGYGELPISTILSISKLIRQTNKFQKLLLVTFSRVPALLSNKLQQLNVDALTQPTVNQVVERVQLALSA
jgi:hypothetical protein